MKLDDEAAADFDQDDGSLFNGLQTIDAWQEYFGHPSGNLLGLMNSAALFPGLIAPFFAEILADRFGRRWAVIIGSLINVSLVQIVASTVSHGYRSLERL
jgi:MFS family permease